MCHIWLFSLVAVIACTSVEFNIASSILRPMLYSINTLYLLHAANGLKKQKLKALYNALMPNTKLPI